MTATVIALGNGHGTVRQALLSLHAAVNTLSMPSEMEKRRKLETKCPCLKYIIERSKYRMGS